MTQSQGRDAIKDEIKKKYSDLFNKLTESEQIRTEPVLNSNVDGKWATSLNQIDFTEDLQTLNGHSQSLTINRMSQ